MTKSELARGSIVFAAVIVSFAFGPSAARAAISVSLCGPSCICIDYGYPGGSYIEVRCEGGGGGGGGGGWTTIPPDPNGPEPDVPGSFGGNGNPGSPAETPPCNPVVGLLSQKLTQARSLASSKLSWVGPPADRHPTTCSLLFRHSPLGLAGKTLLDDSAPFHALFRNGQNCTLPNGGPSPCSSGVAAVSSCCTHSPYIYLCDSFSNLNQTEGGLLLIHELLHVAGQMEDTTTTTGPGNPPTTNQLNDLVRAACLNPQVVTTGP